MTLLVNWGCPGCLRSECFKCYLSNINRLDPLARGDNRFLNTAAYRTFLDVLKISHVLVCSYCTFTLFRKVLAGEMHNSTKNEVDLMTKREVRKEITIHTCTGGRTVLAATGTSIS